MSEGPANTAPRARVSFATLAALYSVVVPVITPFVWFIILGLSNGYLLPAANTAHCLLVSSFVAGVASLIRGSQRRRYLWIAGAGIVLSTVLGYFSLLVRTMPIC